jgi:mannose-6-phosphate isomerase-like protein (cupin superfamily)
MVGIRQRQLEQIEAGEKPAPMDVLVVLARAYGKPLRELLRDLSDDGPYYAVRRSAEIPGLLERRRRLPTDRPNAPVPNSYHPLTPDFPAVHMFPYFIRIRNVDIDTLVPHQHHGHEFFYVLQGEIELVTLAEGEDIRVMLGPGDCCYLDASVPHLLRGETRNPYSTTSAELIDVYWCPLGENYLFDSDRE